TAPPSVPPYTAATGTTINGHLALKGVISSCGSVKACPGPAGLNPRRYDSYVFTNPGPNPLCVTMTLANACTTGANAMLVSAYSPSFDPTSLCNGYLGDPGRSDVP